MKKLNTTLKVNDKIITIMHDDMVFIADATSYPYGIPAAIYTGDIPDDIDAYDLTDGDRYYAYYKDVDVIEAIDSIVFNQHWCALSSGTTMARALKAWTDCTISIPRVILMTS